MTRNSVFNESTPVMSNRSAFAENHKPLLHKIAASFGLSEKEGDELIEDVFQFTYTEYATSKESCALKIWLSKCMVQKCIFLVSCTMFSQYPAAANLFPAIKNSFTKTPIPEIPLSYQTAFVLFHSIGLRETEVAEILNISVLEVRKRLARAHKFIQNH